MKQTTMAALALGSFLVLGVSTFAAAQPAQPRAESGSGMQPGQGGTEDGMMEGMGGMQGGRGMRDEGCSPMCQMMMGKGMRAMPWIMTGSAIFGALLAIALILLIVLEILWIRLWARRLKQQELTGREQP